MAKDSQKKKKRLSIWRVLGLKKDTKVDKTLLDNVVKTMHPKYGSKYRDAIKSRMQNASIPGQWDPKWVKKGGPKAPWQ